MDDPAATKLTYESARKRLGLGKDDHLADYLPHWKEVEMRLAGMAAEAKDPAARASFEKDLNELREVIKIASEEPVKSSSGKTALVWLLITGLLGGLGYLGYQEWDKRGLGDRKNVVNVRETEDRFEEALEKRRWEEAEDLVELLEAEGAEEAIVKGALSRVKKGRIEEKGQQIAFLVSNAQSALEAGQLAEAEKFCAEVEVLQPDHPKVPEFRAIIKESKMQVRSLLMAQEIEKAIKSEDWRAAEKQVEALEKSNAGHPRIEEFKESIAMAAVAMEERQKEAAVMIAQARELDQGSYSAEALALVEKAVRLDPSDENRELYKRMSSYGKVLKVPGDFSTISEALKEAEENDRIFVAKGTYQESLIIPSGVELVGESRGDTIIECPAKVGSVIVVGADAVEVRIAALTLRHSGLVNDEERFPIVAVDGGSVELADVLVTRASGHGVAVLNGGSAVLDLCKISDCGWDGISVNGEGSTVALKNVSSENNLHHGIDFWDGASGEVMDSLFTGNGRAGLLAIAPSSRITVEKTRSEKNREVGFLFTDVVGVSMTDCDIHGNLLGGMVFEGESVGIQLKGNRVTKNGEAGIVFEKGVLVSSSVENEVKDNTGKQIWNDAVFPSRAEEDTISPPPPAPPLEGEGDTKVADQGEKT